MKIGFDLDNTIIDYNSSFFSIAIEKGWVPKSEVLSKSQLREFLIQEDGHDERWQVLQSLVYGPQINRAKIYEGFNDFLSFCIKNKFEIVIISHKTKVSNFNPDIELRTPALNWLKFHSVLSPEKIPLDKIFFCSTLEEKVKKIADEKCDFFVDDLEKVITREGFPKETIPFLFSPSHEPKTDIFYKRSWSDIHKTFISIEDLSFEDIFLIFKTRSRLPHAYSPIKREGNNLIFKFEDSIGSFILKKYYNNPYDSRPRGKTEFNALTLLYKNNFATIPEPLAFNGESALYSFIDGATTKEISDKEDIYLPQFLNFLNSLLELSKVSNPEVANEAADSRKSISDYIKHVERRFKDISQGVQGDARLRIAKDFVLGDLNAVKDRAIEKTKQLAKLNNISLQEEVNQSQRMLSPSDFGLHNCIIKDDTVNFIDFEYFGWDDPAKLMADFFHHVNQVVSQDFKNKLLERFSSIQEDPKLFLTRFNIILHLVEMEWILIVLNVFSEGNLERRLFASPHKKAEEIILPRLEMAKTLVEKASF